MEKFTKITVGFVTQCYEKNDDGDKFVCTHQEFIAGDQVDYEDANGNTITPPKHVYQPFEMVLSKDVDGFDSDLFEACKTVTSYVTELLYKLNDQVVLSDIQEVQQAREVIEKYRPMDTSYQKLKDTCHLMLETLDVGGEQSRQFAEEIIMLKELLMDID